MREMLVEKLLALYKQCDLTKESFYPIAAQIETYARLNGLDPMQTSKEIEAEVHKRLNAKWN